MYQAIEYKLYQTILSTLFSSMTLALWLFTKLVKMEQMMQDV